MTSVVQYTKIMRDAQWDVAKKLGVDLAYEDKSLRAMLLANLAVTATLIKVLVDTGNITDVQLLSAINVVRSAAYSPGVEPIDPVIWDTTPVTGV